MFCENTQTQHNLKSDEAQDRVQIVLAKPLHQHSPDLRQSALIEIQMKRKDFF